MIDDLFETFKLCITFEDNTSIYYVHLIPSPHILRM